MGFCVRYFRVSKVLSRAIKNKALAFAYGGVKKILLPIILKSGLGGPLSSVISKLADAYWSINSSSISKKSTPEVEKGKLLEYYKNEPHKLAELVPELNVFSKWK